MLDSPDFYSSEIRVDRFTDFCVHTARFSGNRLKKVGRLEKIGQWDHGISDIVVECLILRSGSKLFNTVEMVHFQAIGADTVDNEADGIDNVENDDDDSISEDETDVHLGRPIAAASHARLQEICYTVKRSFDS